MAVDGETGTCLEGVQEIDLRDRFASALFSKFEECETEKDLKKKIIEILDDNNIDFEVNTEFTQYKSKIAQYVNCAIEEITAEGLEQDRTIQLSQIVTGIVSFLCNPPKFEFPKLKFELKLSFFLKALLSSIIDSLIQLLANLISSLISLSFELCENNKLLDFDLQANINNLLDFSALERIFGKYDIITQGNQAIIQNLDNCETPFQLSGEEQQIANAQRPLRDNTDGTRSRSARGSDPTNFISDLDLVINPLELCSLFEGAATDTTLDTVKELLRYEYPEIYTKIDTNEKLTSLFKDIGNTIDPSVCESLRQLRTTVSVDDLCSPDFLRDLDNRRAIALRNKGFPEDITRQLLDKEKKKIADKHAKAVETIGKLRDNPARILDDVEVNVFCKNGKPGIMKLADIPKMDVVADIAVESIFSTYKMAHKLDFDGYFQSKYVTSKPRKTIVKRYGKVVIDTKDGEKTLSNQERPEYKLIKDSQSPILITGKTKFALADIENEGGDDDDITYKSNTEKSLKSIGVKLKKGKSNIKIKGKDYTLDNLYIADLERFDKPKQLRKHIIGAVKESKKRVIRSKHSRTVNTTIESSSYSSYTVTTNNDNPNGTLNYVISLYNNRAFYFPSYLTSEDFVVPALSDTSLLDLPEILQKSDSSLEVDDTQLKMIQKLTGVQIKKSDLERPTLIYQKSNFTDKPYYKTSNGIKELVSVNFPNGYTQENRRLSSEHDVFNQFYKRYTNETANTYLYLDCFANLMARQSFMFDLLAVDDEDKLNVDPSDDEDSGVNELKDKYPKFFGNEQFSYNRYTRLLADIPYESIGNYSGFQKQTLEEFLNDPCTIKDTDELTDPSVLAGAVKIPTVRLLIRNHIMKFHNMFLNTLYFYKAERIYENSEMYVQFLIQTFKQDLTKLSLTGGRLSLGFYDTYFQFLDEYFESQIKQNEGLFDPITGQKVDLNQDFSQDYKLNYFFKLELQYLRDRYNSLFRSVRNEDLILINMLENPFNKETYKNQIYIKFVILDGSGAILTGNLSNPKDSWRYGYAIYTMVNGVEKVLLKNSVDIATRTIPAIDENIKLLIFNRLKETKEFKLLFDYVFSLSKIISLIHIENCLEIIEYDQFASNMLIASDEAIRDSATRASNKRVNRNGVIEDPAEATDCYNPTNNLDNPNAFDFGDVNVSGMLKKLILKLIIQTPIVILKSLVEMTDPNIAIASKLRTAASTATCTPLPVLPFSLALLPFTLIPSPFSVGPPVLPPLGHLYLGMDFAEYLSDRSNASKRKCSSVQFGELGNIDDVASATLCKKGCSEAKYRNYQAGIDITVGTDDCPEE